jgi:hypothetical protein
LAAIPFHANTDTTAAAASAAAGGYLFLHGRAQAHDFLLQELQACRRRDGLRVFVALVALLATSRGRSGGTMRRHMVPQ